MKKIFKRSTRKSLVILIFSLFLVIAGLIFNGVFFKSYSLAAPPFDREDNRKLSIYAGVISLVNKVGNNTYATEIDSYRIRATAGIGVQTPLIGNLISGPNLAKNGDAALWKPGKNPDGSPDQKSNNFMHWWNAWGSATNLDNDNYVDQQTITGPYGLPVTAFHFYTRTGGDTCTPVRRDFSYESDFIPVNPNKTYLLEGWVYVPDGSPSDGFVHLGAREYYWDATNKIYDVPTNIVDKNTGVRIWQRDHDFVANYGRPGAGKWQYWSGLFSAADPTKSNNCKLCKCKIISGQLVCEEGEKDCGYGSYYAPSDLTTGDDYRFWCDNKESVQYLRLRVSAYGDNCNSPGNSNALSNAPHDIYWTNIRLTEINESTDLVGQHLDIDASWMPLGTPEAVDNGLDAISTKINSSFRSAIYAENPSGYAGYFSGKVYSNKYCLPESGGGCIETWPTGGAGGGYWDLAGSVISPKNNYRVTIGDSSLGAGSGNATLRVFGSMARQGAKLYGNDTTIATHVNLGVNSETGKSGSNYTYATVSGGSSNFATHYWATVSGGSLNRASGMYATISGGMGNEVGSSMLWSTVSGGANNKILGASGNAATISGGSGNRIETGVLGFGTICGGSSNKAANANSTVAGGLSNEASGIYSFVGGGGSNMAYKNYSTVSGGQNNQANTQLGADTGYATVSGGFYNLATNNYATISGGYENQASGEFSTISGGGADPLDINATRNIASGKYSTVSGGVGNRVAPLAEGSWAGGFFARANDAHSFVWSGVPSQSPPPQTNFCNSNGAQTFNICAGMGMYLDTAKIAGDVAELMEVVKRDQLKEAELVSIKENDKLGKSQTAYDTNLIGVISSQRTAAIYLGNTEALYGDTEKKPVALVGRVFVNVNNENGAIKLGDPITSSSTPGLGMKATKAGKIIGYALQSENFRDKSTKEILVFVKVGYYFPQDFIQKLSYSLQNNK